MSFIQTCLLNISLSMDMKKRYDIFLQTIEYVSKKVRNHKNTLFYLTF